MQLLKAYDSIAQELEEVREIFEGELTCDIPFIADIVEQVNKFRGKLLRPILVLLCGKACGLITQEHRVIATVAELVHMATLIHDDVLDGAQRRRRGVTINALHGNEAAVMLGDMFISHAFHLCSSLDSQLTSRLIAATTNTVCEGELMQLYYRGYYELTEEQYLEIIARKTASLTATCCYLGGQAALADEKVCRTLEKYGQEIGMAFQIMDDITDLTGDEKKTGKTLRTDLLKEKLTLPVIHFFKNGPEADRRWACEVLQQRQQQEYRALVQRLEEQGSMAYARRRAGEFVARAQAALSESLEGRTRDILRELADSLVD